MKEQCHECGLLNMEEAVRTFHKSFGIPYSDRPVEIDRHAFARRLRLINEELSEYCKAVGARDIVEIADALGDLLYVVYGACVEHGIPINRVLNEIHVSNMTKVGGTLDTSGKLIKPSTYKPVDLSWLKGW